MTAEELKASVLEYAMSGALSTDWREVHKRTLSEWQELSLSEICVSMRYGTAKKSLNTGKVAVLRMGNLQYGEIDWTNLAYTNDEEDIKKYLLTPGDVLFNRTNSPELVGKTSIYRGEFPAIYAGYIIKLDYNKRFIIGEYLNFVMNSKREREFCLKVKTNGVCQANINARKIGEFVIPVPPLEEQKYIVSRLKSMLPVIEEYGKAHDALQAVEKALPGKLRASLLQEAISGRLVPQRDDEPAVDIDVEEPDDVPFAIPDKWKWVRLGKVITLISGRDLVASQISSEESEIPYITGGSQIENECLIVNRWTNNACSYSEFGDVLIVCKGSVGKLAINNVGKIHIARQIMALRSDIKIIYTNFLLYYMKIKASSIAKEAKGIIPGISRKDILESVIPLPPLAEQRRIVERLNELLPSVEAMEKLYQQ